MRTLLYLALVLAVLRSSLACTTDADCTWPMMCDSGGSGECAFIVFGVCNMAGTPGDESKTECLCSNGLSGDTCDTMVCKREEFGDVGDGVTQASEIGISIDTAQTSISSGILTAWFRQTAEQDRRLGRLSINSYTFDPSTHEADTLLTYTDFTNHACVYERSTATDHTVTFNATGEWDCTDYYSMAISLVDLVSDCSAHNYTEGGSTIIKGVARSITYKAHNILSSGEPVLSSVTTEMPWTITFPSSLNVTTQDDLVIVGAPFVTSITTTLVYSRLTNTFGIEVAIVAQYPYKMTAFYHHNFTGIDPQLTDISCPEIREENCVNKFYDAFTIPGGVCDLSGRYTFDVTFDCQSQVTECPPGIPSNYSGYIDVSEFTDICGVVDTPGYVSGTLIPYSDDAHTSTQNTFKGDDRVYLQANFTSNGVISDSLVDTITLIFDDVFEDTETILFQSGSATAEGTSIEIQIDYPTDASLIEFSFLVDKDRNGLFDVPGVSQANYRIRLLADITYDFQARKRSTEQVTLDLEAEFKVTGSNSTTGGSDSPNRHNKSFVIVIVIVTVFGTLFLFSCAAYFIAAIKKRRCEEGYGRVEQ